jgi:hypothetical protein
MKLSGILVIAAVGLLVPVANADASSNQAAASAVGNAVQARLPSATQLFVNCPSENTIQDVDGSTDQNCEFRVLVGNTVNTGVALAKPVGGQYQAELFFSSPVVDKWRRCSTRGAGGGNSGQKAHLVKAHGVACGDLKLLESDIRQLPLQNFLRLPRHFMAVGHGTNTVGFVIFAFSCRGRNRVIHGPVNPYGLLTAKCFNSFGDGFIYKFEQSS